MVPFVVTLQTLQCVLEEIPWVYGIRQGRPIPAEADEGRPAEDRFRGLHLVKEKARSGEGKM